MTRRGVALMAALVTLAAAISGCQPQKPVGDPLRPAGSPPATPSATPDPTLNPTLPSPGSAAGSDAPGTSIGAAPHVYMALQPDGAGPLSIVFAIDAARDGTPGDDPAIRLTPEDGKCNPQSLRRYAFAPNDARKPVFGPEQVVAGITARELPNFMAISVTSEMMERGMIVEPEQSHPQNVCTRKLWQRMILNESLRTGQTG